jgi:hypothetical protein
MRIFRITAVFATLILPATPFLTAPADAQGNESNARPPVTQVDLEIAARAREILDSPSKWNRADTRVCPPTATKFSLYCALEKATKEKSGKFAHRDAAMQEARFVIEDIAPHVNSYEHRLKDYNNDPSTTFADVQKFFEVLETHITKRLASEHIEATPPAPSAATPRSPTQADLQVLQRARDLLDSPERWNRHDDQNCKKQTKTISLFCAMDKASNETPGNSGAVMQEARAQITEMDPTQQKYKARLTDYNNDPTVTFADLQKFFADLQLRLTDHLTAPPQQGSPTPAPHT